MNILKERIALFAAVTTVAIMYSSFVWLQPYATNVSGLISPTAGSIAAALASFGVYRVILDMVLLAMSRFRWLRKLALGAEYLEGTWVGCYEAKDKTHRVTLEYIDQSSGITVIIGRALNLDGKVLLTWSSETVSIDSTKKELVYAYICKSMHETSVWEGLATFQMISEEAGKPANRLEGYSVDVHDGERGPNSEVKAADHEITDKQAIQIANRKLDILATSISNSTINAAKVATAA